MLGVNTNGNNWKLVLANFIIVLFGAIVAELLLKLPSGTYPTSFEIYECLLKGTAAALTATGLIYGVNKATHGES